MKAFLARNGVGMAKMAAAGAGLASLGYFAHLVFSSTGTAPPPHLVTASLVGGVSLLTLGSGPSDVSPKSMARDALWAFGTTALATASAALLPLRDRTSQLLFVLTGAGTIFGCAGNMVRLWNQERLRER